MKVPIYRERDHAYGRAILALRNAVGLTQAGLADFLGVSRHAVGQWEAGGSYPKAEHLKQLIALAIKHQAFRSGHEAEDIRALWQAAHQKILLDETWLSDLLAARTAGGQDMTTGPGAGPGAGIGVSAGHPVTADGLDGLDGKMTFELLMPSTTFVGRGTELAAIATSLEDPACHLLTLLGPGGVGKTRLALAVAAAKVDTRAYADGVAYVPLISVNTADQVVSAIVDALRLSFAGLADPVAHLLAYLRGRHMLLVLDGFEHLFEAADLVNDIVRRAPRVTTLVTSRVRLNLESEWLFDVEGLAYPKFDHLDSPGPGLAIRWTDYSAIQLFVQRATQVLPELPLTEAILASIGRICQHVAGMPLAIELAAAGVRSLPVAEIERQIRSNLGVLATTRRDVPVRHRSMHAVFDHSWGLLDGAAQTLLSRLAVFSGGWTLSAAEQVAGATLAALTTLVDQSLVRRGHQTAHATTDLDLLLVRRA